MHQLRDDLAHALFRRPASTAFFPKTQLQFADAGFPCAQLVFFQAVRSRPAALCGSAALVCHIRRLLRVRTAHQRALPYRTAINAFRALCRFAIYGRHCVFCRAVARRTVYRRRAAPALLDSLPAQRQQTPAGKPVPLPFF